MLKRLFLLAILLLVLFIVSFFSFKIHIKSSSQLDIFSSCDKIKDSERATECYTDIMLANIKKNPANIKSLFATLYQKSLRPDFPSHADLHEIGHESGELIAFLNKDPYKAFFSCGMEFDDGGGCYHGVVMTYIDETQPAGNFSFEKAFQFCDEVKRRSSSQEDYSNCVHGIGHIGIIKVKGDLSKALTACDILGTAANHCYDGVFMEYSRGDSQTGLHIHAHPLGSIVISCKDLAIKYKASCYKFIGRHNPAFAKDQKDYYGGSQICDTLDEDYRIYCQLGIGRRVLLATGYDIQKAGSICAGLGKYSQDCKQAIIIDKVYRIEQWPDPNDLCLKLPEDFARDCVQSKVAYYNLTLP